MAETDTAIKVEPSSDSTQAMERLLAEFGTPESTDGNSACSPLNIYLALAMLTDCTNGESRAQLLHLLGSDNLEDLKSQADTCYASCNYTRDIAGYGDQTTSRANFTDYDMVSRLSSSLWLSDRYSLNTDAAGQVADDFHASVNAGTMGSDEFNEAYQTWLNDNTGGLLESRVCNSKLDPATVLALVSAIYYKAPWTDDFAESVTKSETFHSPGKDIQVPMMFRSGDMQYSEENDFTAVGLALMDGCTFYVFLPVEGRDPSTLLTDRDVLELIENKSAGSMNTVTGSTEYRKVNLHLPRIDVGGSKKLTDGLKKLGVRDVFDAGKADFSPILAESGVNVGTVQHSARLTADEKGIVAAAYTEIAMAGSLPRQEEPVEFKVDRPFAFAVSDNRGTILFAGTVNNPVG